MADIELKACDYIPTYKALEYLGLGWLPYVDNDERLLDADRENIRIPFNDKKPDTLSDKQAEYFDKMHNALALLQLLIRTKKIKLYPSFQGVVHIEWTNENFSENDILSQEEVLLIEKESPSSVYLLFGNVDESPLMRSFSRIDDDGGFDYCIVIENKYGTFFYHDWPNIIKFSEIEPYYKVEKNIEKSRMKVSSNCDGNYMTPYMEIMFEVIKENDISEENQGNIDSLKVSITEKMLKRNLPKSDKLVSSMATIIRLPEAQTGSAYHSRKRAKTKK